MLARASLRYLWRHRWQLVLAVAGITVGVAVVVAIDLANSSAQRAFSLSREALTGAATHQIVGGPHALPEGLYKQLRLELGLRASAPVVEARVAVAQADGETGLRLLGIDPVAEGDLGRDLAGTAGGDPLRLMSELGTALMTAEQAGRLGLQSGDTFELRHGGPRFTLTLVGVLEPGDPLARQGLDGVVLTDIATAQEVLGQAGRLSRIDVIAEDAALRDAIARLLPPDADLLEAQGRSAALEQMTRAFRLNLTAMSLLALMVGGFLIYNTVTFSVVQRRPLLGALRALGVTRAEVLRLLLLEGALLGLVGSLLGMALGIVLAEGLLHLVSRTINDLYYTTTVARLSVAPADLVKGLALGLGAALVATAVPAHEAVRTPPRASLSRAELEARVRRALPRLATLGALLLAAAVVLLAIPSRSLLLGFGGLFLLLAGFALLTPALTVGILALVRPLWRKAGGLLGAMAVRGIRRALSRTAVAIAALSIAVAASVGVGIMVDSFRGTVVHWLENTLRADIFIASDTAGVAVDPVWIERLADLPGLDYLSFGRRVDLETARGPVQLFAMHIPRASFGGFDLKQGAPGRAAEGFFDGNVVLISEPFAYRHRLGVGDHLSLPTRTGVREFAIAGVYYDYGSDQGYVALSRETYLRHWDDPTVTSLGVYLREGAALEPVLAEVRRRLAGAPLEVQSNRGVREASLAIFDRTFTITSVLRVLAVLVAFAGILSALMAIQLERAREFAVLRATGLTPRQLWLLVTGETGLMGLAAGMLALPLGLAMSLILVFIINRRSFGWSMQMQIDPTLLVQALGLALLAALLAGLYPAWRMARTPPALALRND